MTLYVITGPPSGGKTTYVREHAKPGDITIDFDSLANALCIHDDPYIHSDAAVEVTRAAWISAIRTAEQLSLYTDVYVIHAAPSPDRLERYRLTGARIVVCDPGQDEVLRRARADNRPAKSFEWITKWYAQQTNSQQHEWVRPSW